MAFYNSLRDLTGDISAIAHGKNPMNNNTAGQYVPTAGQGVTNSSTLPVVPKTGQTGNPLDVPTGSNNPLDPNYDPGAGVDESGDGGSSLIGEFGGFIKDHLGDIAGGIADFAKKYGMTALEAYNVYEAAKRQGQAQDVANAAIKTATDAYATKAPLRTAGQAGMLNPSANTPDLSNIRALATTGSGNPFAKTLPVAGVATKPPGYDATGKLNGTAASLPVAGSLPTGITPSGGPLPPGAQAAIDAASHAGPPAGPGSTTTVNYGGQQYTPAQWAAYQQSHPNWSTPANPTSAAPKLPVAPVAPTPTPVTPKLTLPVAGTM